MAFKSILCLSTIVLFFRGAAIAQGQDSAAIKKLAFLSGSWHCAVQGNGVPAGVVDNLSYEFSPDWSWMIERSHSGGNAQPYWSVQLWGYDARREHLIAYKFDSTGVSTKTVKGWIEGRFQSIRDDNGATVSIKPINSNAFDWVIESANRSTVITERCTR